MRKDFERTHVTAHGTIALLTLNHPGAMNAISVKMLKGLMAALNHIEDPENGFRAVVMTGEGRGFCSGANLTEPQEDEAPYDVGSVLETAYHPFLRRLRDLKMPLVTAVNGAAAGVGMSIALMGDIVLAARSAYFLQAFVRIGLIPDGGSTWLLPRLIGLARARELSMLAEKLPAEKALEWGLINRVSDDAALIDDAMAVAGRLAEGPTLALSMIRRLYWESPHSSYEEQLDLERKSQQQASRTGDFIEGVSAFLQKRSAEFKGR